METKRVMREKKQSKQGKNERERETVSRLVTHTWLLCTQKMHAWRDGAHMRAYSASGLVQVMLDRREQEDETGLKHSKQLNNGM